MLFNYFFSLSQYPIIAQVSLFLSYPFTYGTIFVLLIWAVFFSKRKMFNFSLLFLSGLSSWLISSILKNVMMISRPFIHNANIKPLLLETGFSFPSQHTALFASFAVVIFFINKKVGIVFIFLTILVGLSRVIIGVHYPIDIIGGIFVGLFTGVLLIKIFKNI